MPRWPGIDRGGLFRPAAGAAAGGITPDQLSAVCGCEVSMADSSGRAQHLPAPAPGMLASHYAPRKALTLRVMPVSLGRLVQSRGLL